MQSLSARGQGSPYSYPQCTVCLCKLLVDKREIEELVYTLRKFLLNLIFEGPNY